MSAPSKRLRHLDLSQAVQLLAVIPVVAMVSHVLHSSQLQFGDYWLVADRTFNPDGSLALSQLLTYHNGHVLALPGVVYWLNFKLTGGLNQPLGLFVVAVGLVQLLALRTLLPRPSRIGRWGFGVAFLAIAALLFSPQGVHNFARSMSGVAWLLANLLAVAAIMATCLLRRRWAPFAAMPFAALATVTYGTGLMAWPAIVVAAWLQGASKRVMVVTTGTTGIALAVYFGFYEHPATSGGAELDPADMTRRVLRVLGSAVAPDPASQLAVGVVTVVVAAVVCWRAAERHRHEAAPWIALVVYAVLGAAMIGLARSGALAGDPSRVHGRYSSLSALCWSGVVVLALLTWRMDGRVVAATAAVALFGFVAGATSVQEVENHWVAQEETAIAIRQGTSHGYPPFSDIPDLYERPRSVLQAIGHYPFTADFDPWCGLYGQVITATDLADSGGGIAGTVDGFQRAYNEQSVRVHGWVASPDDSVRCVVVVDDTMEVVGAGVYGVERSDAVAAGVSDGRLDVGFVAVATSGHRQYGVVVVLDSGRRVLLAPYLAAP